MATNSGGEAEGNKIVDSNDPWWRSVLESDTGKKIGQAEGKKIVDSDNPWWRSVLESEKNDNRVLTASEEKTKGGNWSPAKIRAFFESQEKARARARQEAEEKAREKAREIAKMVDEAIVAKRIADGRFALHPETDVIYESDIPLVFDLTTDMHLIIAEIEPRAEKGYDRSYVPPPTRSALEIQYEKDFKSGGEGVVYHEINLDSPEMQGKTLKEALDALGPVPQTPSLFDLRLKPLSEKPNGCNLCGKAGHYSPSCSYFYKFPQGAPLPDPNVYHLVCGCGNKSIFDGFCNRCKGECDLSVRYHNNFNHLIDSDYIRPDKNKPIKPRKPLVRFRF